VSERECVCVHMRGRESALRVCVSERECVCLYSERERVYFECVSVWQRESGREIYACFRSHLVCERVQGL
jgi:hypothetical protein